METKPEPYITADNVLKAIAEREVEELALLLKEKAPISDDIKETARILIEKKFIALNPTNPKQLELTDAGRSHLKNGGFKVKEGELQELPKTFKQQLDESTNLLTTFGILNAIIIFANQTKPEYKQWAAMISASMYGLSILVLWEIISYTNKSKQTTFKFHVLSLLLTFCTIGMGALFIKENNDFLMFIIYLEMGLLALFKASDLTLNLTAKYIERKRETSLWFKKKRNVIIVLMASFMFSISIVVLFFKLMAPYIIHILSYLKKL